MKDPLKTFLERARDGGWDVVIEATHAHVHRGEYDGKNEKTCLVIDRTYTLPYEFDESMERLGKTYHWTIEKVIFNPEAARAVWKISLNQ